MAGVGASRRRGTVSGALVATLALLSITALAGSAVVFLGFPRVSTGLLKRAVRERAGVAERIQLGGSGFLKEDPTPVMRVRWPDGTPPAETYWRTAVFDDWDGRSWRRREGPRRPVTRQPIRPLPPAPRTYLQASVDLLLPERSLPTPGEPVVVKFPRRPGQAMPMLHERVDGTLEVLSTLDELTYVVHAAAPRADASLRGLPRAYPPEVLRDLALPEGLDPRIRALADELGQGGDPYDVALSIASRLETTYGYTRQLPGDSADPLARFLFETRQGHCEYFAAALAVLLRANGVPARVAAGFYGGPPAEGQDYALVRLGDAHAWTEAYFPGRGWVRFDPTPSGNRAGEATGRWAWAVENLDALRARWSRWVLDYAGQDQAALAAAIAEALAPRGQGGRTLGTTARWAVGVLALAGAIALYPRLRRRLRQERAVPERHRAAVELYREVKRSLRSHGVTLPEAATADEWARAAGVAPDGGAAARAALEAYQQSRFGGVALGRSAARQLRRALP